MWTTKTQYQEGDERIDYVIDFTNRIPSGGSASSATGELEDPSGNRATLVTAVSVASNVVTATVLASEIDEVGTWYLDVLTTLSNSEVVRTHIPIEVTLLT